MRLICIILAVILLTACSFKVKLTNADKSIEASGSFIRPVVVSK